MNGWASQPDGPTGVPDSASARDIGSRLHFCWAGRAGSRSVMEDHSPAVPRRVDQQVRDQGGPPGLMHGTEPGAVVAVEVLVEQQVVLPRRVGLQAVDPAVAGSAAV